MTDPQKQPDREVPILAIYREPSGQYVVEVNETGDGLEDAYAHLATTFARALARPETRP